MALSLAMQLLKSRLSVREMSTEVFGTVATLEGIKGGSRAQLDKAFTNKLTIPEETVVKLYDLWREIESMLGGFLPYSLDTSDGTRLHSSLQCWRCSVRLVGMTASSDTENEPIDSAK